MTNVEKSSVSSPNTSPAPPLVQRLFDLSGRIAVVTGASRGIGAAIAVGLAEAGCDVVVTARRVQDLDETTRAISATGRRASAISMDVRDLNAIVAGFADINKSVGPPDILVNNAGVEQVRPSTDVDDVLWDQILDTNLRGAFFCAREAGRGMIDRGRGTIINICSLASGIGIPTATPYGASKSGLLGVTRALSTEWQPHGIRVNAIAPGYFRTSMTDAFYQDIQWHDTMLAKIPAGRFGDLSDLIGATVFLASDASLYVSGQMIYVDGGYMAAL
jgi:NAD(P)-dependent dehydrogenase (short-subunit alcohol dehydrogenase family)